MRTCLQFTRIVSFRQWNVAFLTSDVINATSSFHITEFSLFNFSLTHLHTHIHRRTPIHTHTHAHARMHIHVCIPVSLGRKPDGSVNCIHATPWYHHCFWDEQQSKGNQSLLWKEMQYWQYGKPGKPNLDQLATTHTTQRINQTLAYGAVFQHPWRCWNGCLHSSLSQSSRLGHFTYM